MLKMIDLHLENPRVLGTHLFTLSVYVPRWRQHGQNFGFKRLQKLVNKKIVIRAFNIIKRVRPDFRAKHSKVCILSRQNAHFALEKTSRK